MLAVTLLTAELACFFFQEQIGFKCHLLDIGGGFPGAPNAAITFEEVGIWNVLLPNNAAFLEECNATAAELLQMPLYD